jgi:hypothetical protein
VVTNEDRAVFRLWRIAVLAGLAALTAGVFAVTSAAGNTKWSQSDFRLREIDSSLGALSTSQITFTGTMSGQAYDADLGPLIEFNISLAITCHPDGDPADTTTYPGTYTSRIGAPSLVESSTQYTNVGGGTIRWTQTFDFVDQPSTGEADGTSYEWCDGVGGASGAQVLDGITVTGASGIAWLSQFWLSPEPGTTLYRFTLSGGDTVQRIQPKDGTPS